MLIDIVGLLQNRASSLLVTFVNYFFGRNLRSIFTCSWNRGNHSCDNHKLHFRKQRSVKSIGFCKLYTEILWCVYSLVDTGVRECLSIESYVSGIMMTDIINQETGGLNTAKWKLLNYWIGVLLSSSTSNYKPFLLSNPVYRNFPLCQYLYSERVTVFFTVHLRPLRYIKSKQFSKESYPKKRPNLYCRERERDKRK